MRRTQMIYMLLVLASLSGCLESTWQRTCDEDTIGAYKRFISEHPETEYAIEAHSRAERLLWQQVAEKPDVGSYETYLKEYPQGKYRAEAEGGIERLKWELARDVDTHEGYRAYLEEYPSGAHSELARKGIEEIVWRRTEERGGVQSYERYLEEYPSGEHSGLAREAIETIVWHRTKEQNDVQGYERYLHEYPSSQYCEQAKKEIVWHRTQEQNDLQGYQRYLQEYPEGTYALKAKDWIENVDWEIAKKADTREAYTLFLERHPWGQHRYPAKACIERLAWETVQADDSIGAYRQYLEEFPDGEFSYLAERGLADLLWEEDTSTVKSLEHCRDYLKKCPNGKHAEEARGMLAEALWNKVTGMDSPFVYRRYLHDNPDSAHAAEAKRAVERDTRNWSVEIVEAGEMEFEHKEYRSSGWTAGTGTPMLYQFVNEGDGVDLPNMQKFTTYITPEERRARLRECYWNDYVLLLAPNGVQYLYPGDYAVVVELQRMNKPISLSMLASCAKLICDSGREIEPDVIFIAGLNERVSGNYYGCLQKGDMRIGKRVHRSTQSGPPYLGRVKLALGAPQLPEGDPFEPPFLSRFNFEPGGKLRLGLAFQLKTLTVEIDEDGNVKDRDEGVQESQIRSLRIFGKEVAMD